MKETNLIPASERSKEEVRKNSRLGGINSGKARKRKKELKERIMLAFEIYTKKLKDSAKTKEDKAIIDKMGADVFQIMSIAYDSKTRKETRLKALDMLWDRTIGKPTQQIDQTITEKQVIPATVIDFGNLEKKDDTPDTEAK